MNNKGQTLALFVIILPLFIMIFALIIDSGLLLTDTYKVKSTIKETIKYGLKEENSNEELMNEILKKNLKGLDITEYQVAKSDSVKIKVSGIYHSMFGNIFKKSSYKYSFTYEGNIRDGQYVIEEK